MDTQDQLALEHAAVRPDTEAIGQLAEPAQAQLGQSFSRGTGYGHELIAKDEAIVPRDGSRVHNCGQIKIILARPGSRHLGPISGRIANPALLLEVRSGIGTPSSAAGELWTENTFVSGSKPVSTKPAPASRDRSRGGPGWKCLGAARGDEGRPAGPIRKDRPRLSKQRPGLLAMAMARSQQGADPVLPISCSEYPQFGDSEPGGYQQKWNNRE